MESWNKAGKRSLVFAAALLITLGASSRDASAVVAKAQTNCQGALTKAIAKHLAAVGKAMATCETAALAAGTDPATTCPDQTAQDAIDKSAAKAGKAAIKKCQSSCSLSHLSCIDTAFCPPSGKLVANAPAKEVCTNGLSASGMGFPGPFCETLIGHKMTEPEDFGACAIALGAFTNAELFRNVFGHLDGSPLLSSGAAGCLAAIANTAPKALSKIGPTVSKCRNAQLADPAPAFSPDDCPTADSKTSSSIGKSKQAVLDAMTAACSDATVQELDLCGQGVGGVTSLADAKTCVGAVLDQVGFSVDSGDNRSYAPVSIINGAYPLTAPARCGDDVINQLPSQFLLNGEECDGTDDTACPGECLPPGDMFECTCGNVRRSRTFAYGFQADLDNGWSGSSHNNAVTNQAGFVAELSNCDCDHFDPLNPSTCDGTSSDKVCDVFSEIHPRCSNHIGDHTSCDDVGDGNGVNSDSDCHVCDQYSTNTGRTCTGKASYCLLGANDGDKCNDDNDCPGGTCSGTGRCADDGGPFALQGCSSIASASCGICVGGGAPGSHCSTSSNCLGGTCTAHACYAESCFGGSNDGKPCSDTFNAANPDIQCPGGHCVATSDCGSQCFDTTTNLPAGPCWRQADCAAGQRCRGVCDDSAYCLKIRNGAPLPLSAEGTSVCVDSQFFSDVTGTKNIVTGEHEINYELRSVTYLTNDLNSVPCPVCGGWCAVNSPGQAHDRQRCNGTCTGPEKACRYGPKGPRFEVTGATCTTNVDCSGYFCSGGVCQSGPEGPHHQVPGDSCTNNTDCGGFLCSGVDCRFDEDCPSGTCSGTASPDCQGKDCSLALTCNSGPNKFKACRIEAATAFGTTSADCQTGGNNQTGAGLQIKWEPLTSGIVSLPNPAPCNAPGYQNYDCNCVFNQGATKNQPNRCGEACNDPNPAYYGRPCAGPTVCVGGLEAGAACDDNADCSGGGTCTGNPRVCGAGNIGGCSVKHCVAGSNAGKPCATDIQCPGSTCGPVEPCTVGGAACTDGICIPDNCTTNADCTDGGTCDDACPAGICGPLCTARGICSGGDRDGDHCALTPDCTGGGTCVTETPVEEGACAIGNFNHCDGPGWEFVQCPPLAVGGQKFCESGVDGLLGNSDDQVGAGYCRADITNCFINNGQAEGGSTLNHRGDPTNQYSVAAFCIPASESTAVNATAGLPGPGRIRQPSLAVPNFDVLP